MDSIDSLEGMKNALPGLRRQLNTDPVYFKKVYMHTFDLAKAPGARTLTFDTGEFVVQNHPWLDVSHSPLF
jgi:DCN1-like protein 1/2